MVHKLQYNYTTVRFNFNYNSMFFKVHYRENSEFDVLIHRLYKTFYDLKQVQHIYIS